MTTLEVGDYKKIIKEGCWCNWDGPLKEKSDDIIEEYKIVRRTNKFVIVVNHTSKSKDGIIYDTYTNVRRKKIRIDEEGNEYYDLW